MRQLLSILSVVVTTTWIFGTFGVPFKETSDSQLISLDRQVAQDSSAHKHGFLPTSSTLIFSQLGKRDQDRSENPVTGTAGDGRGDPNAGERRWIEEYVKLVEIHLDENRERIREASKGLKASHEKLFEGYEQELEDQKRGKWRPKKEIWKGPSGGVFGSVQKYNDAKEKHNSAMHMKFTLEKALRSVQGSTPQSETDGDSDKPDLQKRIKALIDDLGDLTDTTHVDTLY
jgi:hypothetical protein